VLVHGMATANKGLGFRERSTKQARFQKDRDGGTEAGGAGLLFVLKPYRRRGVSVSMLRAAVEFAAKRGATTIEGYPTEPTMEHTPDPFVWTGTPSAFRKAGFREVLRRSNTRPIMRFTVEQKHH
jgi:GNAT superfamily N-acetyltransferase